MKTSNEVLETVSLVVLEANEFYPHGAEPTGSNHGRIDGDAALVTRWLQSQLENGSRR